jgi:hypothetical protein
MRKTLVPLLDPTASLDARILPMMTRTGLEVPTAAELVAALVESDDPWLKACGISSIGSLDLTNLASQVDACLDAENEILREAARAAKKRMADAARDREATG